MVDPSADARARPRPAEPPRVVSERRAAARYPARRVGLRSRDIRATLIDLSDGGLAIESLEHPPIGATLAFVLEQGRARVEVDGEVCWCSLKRTYRTAEGDVVPVYRAGLRLGADRPRLFDSLARTAKLDWVAGNA